MHEVILAVLVTIAASTAVLGLICGCIALWNQVRPPDYSELPAPRREGVSEEFRQWLEWECRKDRAKARLKDHRRLRAERR